MAMFCVERYHKLCVPQFIRCWVLLRGAVEVLGGFLHAVEVLGGFLHAVRYAV
jgi:hypothetical protein